MNRNGSPWVLVAGGVNRHGGTDKANFALVEYLLEREIPVHVVTHRIEESLRAHPGLHVDLVPVPARSWLAGERLLSFRGRQVAQRTTMLHPGSRVVVNGGNCFWGDINWVHRVHHAWSPGVVDGPWMHRLKHRLASLSAKRREMLSLRSARLVIANSSLTRRHLIELLNVKPDAVHAVQLGSESDWAPVTAVERHDARERLRLPPDRLVVAFIGAIGYDNNKGLDTLFHAWKELSGRPDWNAVLVIAGDGRALPQWKDRVSRSDFSSQIRFLGFTERITEVLAAADLLVSPVRYESYGLNVQEALCRGIPAIVSAGAGVAERYPRELRALLLPDPEDTEDLVDRMLNWRGARNYWKERVTEFSNELRKYSWRDMAERFYSLASGASA
jgi:glycosyltransferase involved in cell wall biosynthesis